MTHQYLYGATVVVFAFGVVAVDPHTRSDGMGASCRRTERERDRGGMFGSWRLRCAAERRATTCWRAREKGPFPGTGGIVHGRPRCRCPDDR